MAVDEILAGSSFGSESGVVFAKDESRGRNRSFMLLSETLIPLEGVDVSITGVSRFLLCHLDGQVFWTERVAAAANSTSIVPSVVFARVSRSPSVVWARIRRTSGGNWLRKRARKSVTGSWLRLRMCWRSSDGL